VTGIWMYCIDPGKSSPTGNPVDISYPPHSEAWLQLKKEQVDWIGAPFKTDPFLREAAACYAQLSRWRSVVDGGSKIPKKIRRTYLWKTIPRWKEEIMGDRKKLEKQSLQLGEDGICSNDGEGGQEHQPFLLLEPNPGRALQPFFPLEPNPGLAQWERTWLANRFDILLNRA